MNRADRAAADRAAADLPAPLAAPGPALRAQRPDCSRTTVPRPTGLHLHQATRDGIPYVDIELACPWDATETVAPSTTA